MNLNPMQMVAAGRGTADDIWAKLKHTPGSRPTDSQVVAVFSKPSELGKIAEPLVFFNSPDAYATSKDLVSTSEHFGHVAVGIVSCILDRKSKKFVAHAHALLLDAASLKLLESLVAKAAEVGDCGRPFLVSRAN